MAAAVVLTEDDPDFEQKLDEHMREKLAGYKVPRMYLKVTHMPLNSTSKPDKLELQKLMNQKHKMVKHMQTRFNHYIILTILNKKFCAIM